MHFQCAGTCTVETPTVSTLMHRWLYKEAIHTLKWQSVGKKKHFRYFNAINHQVLKALLMNLQLYPFLAVAIACTKSEVTTVYSTTLEARDAWALINNHYYNCYNYTVGRTCCSYGLMLRPTWCVHSHDQLRLLHSQKWPLTSNEWTTGNGNHVRWPSPNCCSVICMVMYA